MTAAQVLLDDSSFWLLVALMCLASAAAIVASVAAWRAAKSARVALSHLEAARREAVVPDRERHERSPIPRRASDVPRREAEEPSPRDAIPPPAPPIPAPTSGTAEAIQAAAADAVRTPGASGGVGSGPGTIPAAPAAPARRSDMLEDPDRGGGAPPADLPPRRVKGTAPTPDALRTEPLSRPRQAGGPEEREVEPGVFVTTPGGAPPHPGPPAPAPAAEAPGPDASASGDQVSEPGAPRSEPRAAVAPRAGTRAAPAPGPREGRGSPAEAAHLRMQKLEDPDPFVRIEAMEQLRGHPGQVDALIGRLRDDFPFVRRQAVRALKETGTPEATKALLEVASQDPSAEVREEAVGALAALLGGGKGRPGEGRGPDAPKNGTDET